MAASITWSAMAMPAHRDVGFDEICNRRTGVLQANSQFVWSQPGYDGFQQEKNDRGDPSLTIEITVANAKASGQAKNFYGLFTKEIEQWWQGLMSLAPEHPRRHEEVARIDVLLPQYHAARAARGQANAVPWFKLLTQIQQQCFMHLAGKPTSDRRAAVMGLAKQVLAIVQGFKNAGAAA